MFEAFLPWELFGQNNDFNNNFFIPEPQQHLWETWHKLSWSQHLLLHLHSPWYKIVAVSVCSFKVKKASYLLQRKYKIHQFFLSQLRSREIKYFIFIRNIMYTFTAAMDCDVGRVCALSRYPQALLTTTAPQRLRTNNIYCLPFEMSCTEQSNIRSHKKKKKCSWSNKYTIRTLGYLTVNAA
jgi:hypothetical protein